MPSETPPSRVKKPCAHAVEPGEARSLKHHLVLCHHGLGARQQLTVSERRRRGKPRARQRERLEENTHRLRIGEPAGA